MACLKASDCWAVGEYENKSDAFLNEALHFNGKKWSVVKTPDPGGEGSDDDNFLSKVACVKASDCWAVGYTESGDSAADLNEALHFNGRKWSVVKTPDPAGKASDDDNELSRVTCVKASDCWAVGFYESGSGAPDLNEALHFNGKKWSVVPTPDPGGKGSDDENRLIAVTCVKASDCWTVGAEADLNEALHFNGKKWSVVATPDPAGMGSGSDLLEGVTCAKASQCWAVGETESGSSSTATDRNEALRWNGKKWSVVPTPQPSTKASEFGNPLVSVSCTSTKNCWTVGYYVNSGETAILNDAMHWNGKKWSHVSTPQPAGNPGVNGLFGVSCTSASECRAVGTDGPSLDALSNQALHWNGKKWMTG